MSEEDIELRDLVAQTLESNGTLAKIKAQLRASIFLALDEDEKVSNLKPSLNNKITTFLETEEGRAMFCVVHEFLEFFDMNFTLPVYQSESYCGNKYKYEGSQKLKDKLGLENISNIYPLLFHLLNITQTKAKTIRINLDIRGDQEEKSASVNTEFDNTAKTVTDSISLDVEENEKLLVQDISERKFDTTFSLTSPSVNLLKAVSGDKYTDEQFSHQNCSQSIKKKTSDNISESSSLLEDGALASLESSNKMNEAITNDMGEENKSRDIQLDKPKISFPKSDKMKSKNSLSNLSDLPPLPLGKSRVSVILPSLYSKESKDKSNSQEHDKLFDMSIEYEEDFMCTGDDLSLKSDSSKINLQDELISANTSTILKNNNTGLIMKDSKHKIPSIKIPDCNKLIKPADNQSSEDT